MIERKSYIKIWKDQPQLGVLYSMVKNAHTEQEYTDFIQWMRGQTVGLNDKNEAVIYSWDYERWIKQGKMTEQGSDWD